MAIWAIKATGLSASWLEIMPVEPKEHGSFPGGMRIAFQQPTKYQEEDSFHLSMIQVLYPRLNQTGFPWLAPRQGKLPLCTSYVIKENPFLTLAGNPSMLGAPVWCRQRNSGKQKGILRWWRVLYAHFLADLCLQPKWTSRQRALKFFIFFFYRWMFSNK